MQMPICWKRSLVAVRLVIISRARFTSYATNFRQRNSLARHEPGPDLMLLVDSNVWLDAADVDCPAHKACAALLRDRKRELVTPAVVVGEAARLICFKLGAAAEAAYVRLVTAGPITIVDLTKDDWERVRELVETYIDRPWGWSTRRSSRSLSGWTSPISPA